MISIASAPARAAQYEQFYGLVQPPFTLTPDPRFLYRSESHEEAITRLLQAIRRKEGFIVLTGDIGTGKTTICRALLEQLDASTFTSLVLNPFLSIEELLREVLLDFGVVSRDAVRTGRIATASKHELISTLHEFLMSLMAIKGSAVLIIDEAQHLSSQVLEEIRILSNLETNDSKLLQIVLVGQLNLLTVLADAQMRQLDQRISMRATLKPLTREEVEAYIAHRLWVARGSTAVTFETEALDLVHRLTGGVPRIINLLCDRALMVGAASRVTRITPGIIDEAAANLDLRIHAGDTGRSGRRAAVVVAVLLLVALAIAAAVYFFPPGRWIDMTAPAPPPRPQLMRVAPIEPRPIPTQDFMPPPLATPAAGIPGSMRQ